METNQKFIKQVEFISGDGKQSVTWYKEGRQWSVTVREHGCNNQTFITVGQLPSIKNALHFIDVYEQKYRKYYGN